MNTQKLDKNEHAVLEVLGDYKTHSKREIAKEIGVHVNTVKAISKRLRYNYNYLIAPGPKGLTLVNSKSNNPENLTTVSLTLDLSLKNVDGSVRLANKFREPYMVQLVQFRHELTSRELQAYMEKLHRVIYILGREKMDKELQDIQKKLELLPPKEEKIKEEVSK